MPDTQSPDAIEREIAAERSALSDTLEALQSSVSAEAIVETVSTTVQRHGGEVGRALADTVKANPAAVALTGVGIAWLIFGANRDQDRGAQNARPAERGGLRPAAETLTPEFDRRVAAADAAGMSAPTSRGSVYTTSGWDRPVEAPMTDDDASRFEQALDRSKAWLEANLDGLRDKSSAVRLRVSRRVADLIDRMEEGTDGLSDEAKAKVHAARLRAIQGRIAVERLAEDAKAKGRSTFERQPLATGLGALLAGAVVGTALPRTRMEDNTYGAFSDRLFDEAEQVWADQRTALKNAAAAAAAEAKAASTDALRSVIEAIPDGQSMVEEATESLRSGAKRVAQASRKAHGASTTR